MLHNLHILYGDGKANNLDRFSIAAHWQMSE